MHSIVLRTGSRWQFTKNSQLLFQDVAALDRALCRGTAAGVPASRAAARRGQDASQDREMDKKNLESEGTGQAFCEGLS